MTDRREPKPLSDEELARENGVPLPDREAMSLMTPTPDPLPAAVEMPTDPPAQGPPIYTIQPIEEESA